MLVNDFLSDTIFQVMKIHQVTHRTVFYLTPIVNPGMYKLTRTLTAVQWKGLVESPPCIFVLLRHSEISLHCLDGLELALQVDTIFIGHDVI